MQRLESASLIFFWLGSGHLDAFFGVALGSKRWTILMTLFFFLRELGSSREDPGMPWLGREGALDGKVTGLL